MPPESPEFPEPPEPPKSPAASSSSNPGGLTLTQWLICIIASIGFFFDTYELLMLPLIIKPAIGALERRRPDRPGVAARRRTFRQLVRLLFFVPAIVGSLFGLLGGYLTDLLGRRRVLTWSILLYALGSFGGGFATSLPLLLFFRCLVFIGVCVEFVAAVAWLAELFPAHKRREKIIGYTQAFSSVGGVALAFINHGLATGAASFPAIHGGHEAWRYTLVSGLIPAIPLILIRPFLPESPIWSKKRAEGTLKRPSIFALFQPGLRKVTILTTLGFAATYGVAFGAIQQHSQIVSGHVDLKTAVVAATATQPAAASVPATRPTDRQVAQIKANVQDGIVATVQKYQEVGGLIGRILLTILIVFIASKRLTLRLFQIPAFLFVPLLFWWISKNMDTKGSLQTFEFGMFLAGLLVVAQMNFWGNYIPLVFPLHLRGTGESFAANIGGRLIGTAAAFLAITLSSRIHLALAAAIVALGYSLVGAAVTHWLPEPNEHALQASSASDA